MLTQTQKGWKMKARVKLNSTQLTAAQFTFSYQRNMKPSHSHRALQFCLQIIFGNSIDSNCKIIIKIVKHTCVKPRQWRALRARHPQSPQSASRGPRPPCSFPAIALPSPCSSTPPSSPILLFFYTVTLFLCPRQHCEMARMVPSDSAFGLDTKSVRHSLGIHYCSIAAGSSRKRTSISASSSLNFGQINDGIEKFSWRWTRPTPWNLKLACESIGKGS